jgi:hypothetical protein
MGVDVRFPREIHLGLVGKDVIAHKRAISRAVPKRYPWHSFSPYAGETFIRAVMEWKKSKGMNSQPLLGRAAHEVLERTHAKNHPQQWAFDPVAVELAKEYYEQWVADHQPSGADVRSKMLQAAQFWYAHRGSIAYSQARPMQLGKPPWVPSRLDCSGFYTNCSYAGGAPDPNGRHYDHLGYTGTLMSTGTRVNSIDDLGVGDAVFYGHSPARPGFPAGSPTHVAFYAGHGFVYSLGHFPMSYYRYNYRSDINHYRHYKVA